MNKYIENESVQDKINQKERTLIREINRIFAAGLGICILSVLFFKYYIKVQVSLNWKLIIPCTVYVLVILGWNVWVYKRKVDNL